MKCYIRAHADDPAFIYHAFQPLCFSAYPKAGIHWHFSLYADDEFCFVKHAAKILVVFDFCKHPPALFRVSAAVINGHLEVIRLPAVFKPFPNPHILIDALKRRPDRVLRTLVLMYLQAFPNS